MPLLERVRVEVYLPDPHLTEYDDLLRTFEEEFTYAVGGCTILRLKAPKARNMTARGKREAKRSASPLVIYPKRG